MGYLTLASTPARLDNRSFATRDEYGAARTGAPSVPRQVAPLLGHLHLPAGLVVVGHCDARVGYSVERVGRRCRRGPTARLHEHGSARALALGADLDARPALRLGGDALGVPLPGLRRQRRHAGQVAGLRAAAGGRRARACPPPAAARRTAPGAAGGAAPRLALGAPDARRRQRGVAALHPAPADGGRLGGRAL